MIKNLYLTFFLNFILLSLNAQRLPNTLLWRIDGKGVNKPFYLYGTMHLTDERLFNLGDSLYKAMENSDGFAIEINPDEISTFAIDEINDEIKSGTFIKSILDDKTYKKYGNILSKKLKKPANKITTRDIFVEKNKWIKESFRKGKMATFLDAYLFDIARRQGKWTGGIEDINDQKGLTNELIDESDIRQVAEENQVNNRSTADAFIKLYIDNNISAIDSITNLSDSGMVDHLLIKRNYKMARRIDSLSSLRSMVFAVGAAHLPGDEGLLNLLANKGFNVQPVYSSHKIKPADYHVKEVEIPWVTVQDADSSYSVLMPGRPGEMKMFGLIKMKMHVDIFNSTGYMSSAVTTPYGSEAIDTIMKYFAQNLFSEKAKQKETSITINGISGKVLEGSDASGYKHGYVLYKNHKVYIAIAFATVRNQKTEQALNTFLNSFKVFESKGTDKNSYFTYIDSIHFFRVDMPYPPEEASALLNGIADKTIKSNLMVSTDNNTGTYFFVSTNRTAPGYFIDNDSATVDNIRMNVRKKFDLITLDTILKTNDKKILKLEGAIPNTTLFTKSYYELQGNHWYGLLAMYDTNAVNPAVNHFFNSFSIIQPPKLDWEQRSSQNKLFKAWVPGNIQQFAADSVSESDIVKYGAYDSTQGSTYNIFAWTLGKYYWQNNDSALWNSILKSNTGYADTLLSYKKISNGDAKGIELQLGQQNSFNIKRKRILLYGDSLYTLMVVDNKKVIESDDINKFFDEFRFNNVIPPSKILQSKAKLLIDDLPSADSNTRTEASRMLASANFDVQDLPLLYKALLKTYPKDSASYITINESIANVIENIKDTSSINMAYEAYNITNKKEIKILLTDIISAFHTRENYLRLKNLLLHNYTDTTLSYKLIRHLEDSLQLTASIISDLQPLLADKKMVKGLIEINNMLLDSNLISLTFIETNTQAIITYANNRFTDFKNNNDDYYDDRHLIHILGKINNTAANAILQKWVTVENLYLKLQCVEMLVKNHQKVAEADLLKLAKDNYYRVDLYKALKKQNKISLFPKRYLTQQYFAESVAYNIASDDEEPSSIDYVTQRITTLKGNKVKVFFYRVAWATEEPSYSLVSAGPYLLDQTKMCEDSAYGNVYYQEDYDKSKLTVQIDALLQDINEAE